MKSLDLKLRKAVKHFWTTRETQLTRQGSVAGTKDTGYRSAVTGGKQMDGFIWAIRETLVDAGLDRVCIYCEAKTELPGYFRPEKRWDVVVVVEGKLVACLEFKSQIGLHSATTITIAARKRSATRPIFGRHFARVRFESRRDLGWAT